VDGWLVHAQGALAQLVARFHGMEEVRGSSPLSSTIQGLVRRSFVIMVEALWQLGLTSAYQSAYQCGSKTDQCGRGSGGYA
jgi:hypothetical protein